MSGSVVAADVAPSSTMAWAEEEIASAGLGDARLDRRLVMILALFLTAPKESIPRQCGSWGSAKAVYRFFDNKKVSLETIIERHRQSVLRRARKESTLLAIQDTTMLDYTSHPNTQGLGPLSDMVHHGFLLHPTMIVTPDRVPLGFISAETWVRDADAFGIDAEEKKRRLIEDKESRKWLNGLGETERFRRELGKDDVQVVSIMDREGDIYEVLHEACQPECLTRVIVRAKNDRALEEVSDRLFIFLKAQEPVSTVVVALPRAPGREPRQATLKIRFAKVTLRVPSHHRKSERLTPVEVTIVSATEEGAPKGVDPIQWQLLTTLAVDNADDAYQVVEWYACRWLIEVLFRVLKTGCESEERQLETAERLKRCLAVDLIVAWRVLYLTMVGRETPNLPCSVVFEDYEWKALYVFVHKSRDAVPEKPPKLQEVVALIARLGGHLGRRRDGAPGTMTLWRGLQRVPDIAEMWQVYESLLE